MNTERKQEGTALYLAPEGRLDTASAPELEQLLETALDGITDLTLDFAKLSYISSAGLRVLLTTRKRMNRQGAMKLIHVNQAIMEIFDITGFSDILTIEADRDIQSENQK